MSMNARRTTATATQDAAAVNLHPLLVLAGKTNYDPSYPSQKPIYAGPVFTSSVDQTNGQKKRYFAIVASDSEKKTGSMLLIREGRKSNQRHHRTLFHIDANAAIRYEPIRDGGKIEIQWGGNGFFEVCSLSSKEKYTVEGKMSLYPDETGEDRSLKRLYNSLITAGCSTPEKPHASLAQTLPVSEEQLLGEFRTLLRQVESGFSTKNMDEARVSNIFKLADEAITTEIKYLVSYDRYQITMRELDVFFSCIGEVELNGFSTMLKPILQRIEFIAAAAEAAVQVIAKYVQDIGLIAGDEPRQLVQVVTMLSRSSHMMHEAEKEMLLQTFDANFLLEEIKQSDKVVKFLSHVTAANDNKPLSDFVSATMQRVTRRPLLLDTMCKSLRSLGCFDKECLQDVETLLETMRWQARQINEEMEVQEREMHIIAKQLKPSTNIDEIGRECLLRVRAQSNSTQLIGLGKLPVILFIFNDGLLSAKSQGSSIVFSTAYAFKSNEVTVNMEEQVLQVSAGSKVLETFDLGQDTESVNRALNAALAILAANPAIGDLKQPRKEARLSATLLKSMGVGSFRLGTPTLQSSSSRSFGEGAEMRRAATPCRSSPMPSGSGKLMARNSPLIAVPSRAGDVAARSQSRGGGLLYNSGSPAPNKLVARPLSRSSGPSNLAIINNNSARAADSCGSRAPPSPSNQSASGKGLQIPPSSASSRSQNMPPNRMVAGVNQGTPRRDSPLKMMATAALQRATPRSAMKQSAPRAPLGGAARFEQATPVKPLNQEL